MTHHSLLFIIYKLYDQMWNCLINLFYHRRQYHALRRVRFKVFQHGSQISAGKSLDRSPLIETS